MPNWNTTVRLGHYFHNDALTFEARRDGIVARLRQARWYEMNSDVADLVDELAETTTTADFDALWSDLYDLADRDRVWIETFLPASDLS